MRILVAGGAGFIGSNFIRHILRKYDEYRVVNLDKLTYCGNLENLKDVEKDKRYKFIKGDIADEKTVQKAARDCDVILNFAAETHVDRSIKDPATFIKTNILGMQVLLEEARRIGVDKLIQASTDEVYGSIEKGSSKEDDPLFPNSPYSASKASADMLARSYFVTYGAPVVITRSSNNFGPYQYPEKIIPLFITNALQNKKVPLYADGMNMRDWLFVEDNCEAIDLVMREGKPGDVYNIGAGSETTNLELTHMILDLLGKDKSLIKFVKDRPGHDKRYALDITKIESLGWRPIRDFRTALKMTIEWYKKNEGWWRRLIKCRQDIRY